MSFDPGSIPTLTLFVMMLAMGMTLGVSDFARIASRLRAFTLGIVGQLVLLPCVAVAIRARVRARPAAGDRLDPDRRSALAFLTVPLAAGLALQTFGGRGR
jgi:predicted Na+-dependent transporter